MRHSTALQHFESDGNIARALEKAGHVITRQAVSAWRKKDVVPRGIAAQLQLLTGGILQVDPALYKKPKSRK